MPICVLVLSQTNSHVLMPAGELKVVQAQERNPFEVRVHALSHKDCQVRPCICAGTASWPASHFLATGIRAH